MLFPLKDLMQLLIDIVRSCLVGKRVGKPVLRFQRVDDYHRQIAVLLCRKHLGARLPLRRLPTNC